MTKEKLETRLKQLKVMQEQTIARVNVISGQMFELQYQLDNLDKKETPLAVEPTKLETVKSS